MRRLDIAIVAETYDPTGGGAERSVAQIAANLAQRGHRVTVIAACQPDRPPPEVAPEVPPPPEAPREGGEESGPGGTPPLASAGSVRVVERSAYRQTSARRLLGFARWAGEQLAAGRFDVSLSATMAAPADVVQPRGGTVRETLARNVAMRPTALQRGLKRLAVACTPKQFALLALERRTVRDPRVKRFVAVSQYVAEQLQRHYGVDRARIDVLPNAAEAPAQARDPQCREAWRREVRQAFGVADDAVVYLFAAFNPRLKGVQTLLRAGKVLAEQARTPRPGPFVIMLAGAIGYAQQAMAAELGIRDRVRIVGPTQQMAKLYCAADVTVLPTWYDPSSKVVIESLMLGVPAITTRYNGAADFLIGEGGAMRGRIVDEPGDVAGLARAMAELADADERRQCSEACAALADELSMARHVERLEAVLATAAEGKHGVRIASTTAS